MLQIWMKLLVLLVDDEYVDNHDYDDDTDDDTWWWYWWWYIYYSIVFTKYLRRLLSGPWLRQLSRSWTHPPPRGLSWALFSPLFQAFFELFLGFMRSLMVLDEPPTNIKKIIFWHFYNFGFLVISGCFFNPVTFSCGPCDSAYFTLYMNIFSPQVFEIFR